MYFRTWMSEGLTSVTLNDLLLCGAWWYANCTISFVAKLFLFQHLAGRGLQCFVPILLILMRYPSIILIIWPSLALRLKPRKPGPGPYLRVISFAGLLTRARSNPLPATRFPEYVPRGCTPGFGAAPNEALTQTPGSASRRMRVRGAHVRR